MGLERSFPPATIAINESLAGAVDLQRRTVTGVVMPAAWTAAALTFAVSHDGVTYGPLMTESGEYSVGAGVAVAGAELSLDPSVFLGWRYVKPRSGTSGAPVNQDAARTVLLAASEET